MRVAVVRLDLGPIHTVELGEAGMGHDDEGGNHLCGDRRHLDLGDLMAKLFELLRGGARGFHAGRVGWDAQRRLSHQPDPQPLHRRADLVGEGPLRRRRVVPGEGIGNRGYVQYRRRVGDHPGEDSLHGRPHPGLGMARHAAAAGLQPDQAAVGGGDPDRAAAIVAVGDREHATHHRGRCAARGPARGAVGVPRVAAGAEASVLGHRQGAELRRVGPAAEHEAGAQERVDDQLAHLTGGVGGALGAEGHRPTGDGGQVLDRDRHAKERRFLASGDPRVRLPGSRASVLVVSPNNGVQLRVALVDGREAGVEQLDGRQLTRP